MEPLLVLTNAEAGSNTAQSLDAALDVLRSGADVEVACTSNEGELDGCLQRRGGRTIVVAGGDGSIHAVTAALHRRGEVGHGRDASAVVALIPLGTGNDFARGLGIPLEPAEAAEIVLKGEVRPVDLLVDCAGNVVVNAVHVGVGAEAGRSAKSWKKLFGIPGYAMGAFVAGVSHRGVRLHVEVDGNVMVDLDRPVLQVAMGNGPSVGGGTRLTPDADPEDGQVDVVVSYATRPWAKFRYTVALKVGRHPERPDVVSRRGKKVTVSGEDFWCNADGELYGPERNRSWRIEPGAMRMVLPPRD